LYLKSTFYRISTHLYIAVALYNR